MAFRSKLPPREDHMRLIVRALVQSGPLGERDLVKATGLTQTQVRSAVDALAAGQRVMKVVPDSGGRPRIALIDPSHTSG